ncbi:MAG: hypothetical protein A2033_16315 [Bacteroidetes bacterium GWA2_31_9]|nr:MAG: hypothetical protein A2033_16315 [Bacteroidetes bacterium GWA2_31_9]
MRVKLLLVFTFCIILLKGYSQQFTHYVDIVKPHSVFCDSKSNVWIATERGVVKYHNGNYELICDLDNITPQYVQDIYEDSNNNMWFSIWNYGVIKFDGVSWTKYTLDNGLVSNQIFSIIQDNFGNMWFATNGSGISVFSGSSWTTFNLTNGLKSDTIYSMEKDNLGNIWLGSYIPVGVMKYDGVSWTYYTVSDGLVSNEIYDIAVDNYGSIWFGTNQGASNFDGTNWTTYTSANTNFGLINNDLNCIDKDNFGNLWFGTVNGVSKYDLIDSVWTKYSTFNGMLEKKVWSIDMDSLSRVWMVTDTKGICILVDSTWIYYNPVYLANNSVFTFTQDLNNNLFIATGGGLTKFDGQSWTKYTTLNYILPNNTVTSLVVNSAGILYVGTASDVIKTYNGTTWSTFYPPLISSNIRSMFIDSNDRFWVGTQQDGVFRLMPGGNNWSNFSGIGLAGNMVNAFYEDIDGVIWIACNNGVSTYSSSGMTVFNQAYDGLVSTFVTDIMQDSLGDMWFSTSGGGISKFDGINWITYSKDDYLPNNTVTCILKDYKNNLWFGTDSGLVKYDYNSWTVMTTSDGLNCNNINSLFEDNQHKIWIGYWNGGASLYDPSINTFIEHINLNDNLLFVYPNPSLGVVNFDVSEEIGEFVLSVYNIQGQVILEKKCLSGNNGNINLKSCQSGLYYVNIKNSKYNITKKIFKE